MSTRKSFWLDQDERDVIDCLIENSIIKQRIIKYSSYHNHNLKDKPFEYDKKTGEVVYYEKDKEENKQEK